MKCPVCEKSTIERRGKYGPFVCCPSGKHGTFSIQGSVMHFTGEVGQMLKDQRIEDTYQRLATIEASVRFQPTLSQLMNAQLASWGWNSSGEMEQLAEFALGNPDEIWDDKERNDPSQWFNQRMY